MTGRSRESSVAAAAILQLLQGANGGRLARAQRATLSWFESSAGRPPVAVDEAVIAAYANAHWRQLRRLLRHRDDRVRHAALWAMTMTRRSDLAVPILELLVEQRHFSTHDFAYAAATRGGEALVAGFEHVALHGRGRRRLFAIECLGMTRGGAPAVAALARVVRRHGFAKGVLNALYNVADVGVVPIAARALTDGDPAVRMDAMAAVLGGLEAVRGKLRLAGRADLTRRVLTALADPRTWREGNDPWASLLGFGVDVLQKLGARALLPFLRRCLRQGVHADHQQELAEIERKLRTRSRRRPVVGRALGKKVPLRASRSDRVVLLPVARRVVGFPC
ncbi:MAG: hypothetical protein IPK26_17325 [Planctomycetes bacterium]|nr:hypothetical protein [Planctomycetota bacterium]